MAIEIRPVTSPAELLAVQRQRYAIFVEELGYADSHADHAARASIDPQDATGDVLGAFLGQQLVGAVRINYGELGDYAQLPCVRRFGPYFPSRLMLISRLVIAPAYRAGTLMGRLGVALYLHARDNRPQTMFGVIACVPAHKDFYRRFGYRQIGPAYLHAGNGCQGIPMAVALHDKAHFDRVGSPAAKHCPRHDSESSDWFAQTFAAEFEADACHSN